MKRVSIWGDWILPTLKQVKKWLMTNRTRSTGPGPGVRPCCRHYGLSPHVWINTH